MFNESKASAILRRQQRTQDTLKTDLESRKRVTIKFKPVVDVVREIKEIAEKSDSKLKFYLSENSVEIKLEGSKLNVRCYEILNTPNDYTGEFKYNINFEYNDNEYFSLYFGENELNKVTYLVVRMIADYEVHETVPKDTFYYKLNRLNQTLGDDTVTITRLNREMLELMTENDRNLFKPV
ncbi:MAG: hypothetical protein ACOYOS_15135 [Syntrophales bacterium]